MTILWWHYVLTIICSYLIGNISVARIIAKTQHKDITKLGSGNPGSTNVLRNLGFVWFFLNLVLDIAKGFIPAYVAYRVFDGNQMMLYIAGVSSVIGHVFPVFFKFKGGKGVATFIGIFFAIYPLFALIVVVAIGGVCWIITQYGSVTSFLLITILVVYAGIQTKNELPMLETNVICVILFCCYLLILFAERSNIQKLLIGRESKVNLLRTTRKKLK